MGHLSTITLESGLMRAELADCGRKPHLDIEVDLHLDELPVALLELSGGDRKAWKCQARVTGSLPSANSNEASCQAGSIVFPVNPAVWLLSNQDIQTKDSTKVSRSKCSLATEEEVQQRCNFVLKLRKVEAYLNRTTLNDMFF